MPFDPGLAHRLQERLSDEPGLVEKKMFGGIGWMLNGNMCVGVYKDWLIARVGDAAAKTLFTEPHVKPMDITGKPMTGWAMIAPEGVAEDEDLHRFIDLSLDFVRTLPPK